MTPKETAEIACRDWFAYQNSFELEMTLCALQQFEAERQSKIDIVLEIGVAHGATLACWAEILKPRLAIAIDPLTIPRTPEQQKSYDGLVSRYSFRVIPHISRLDEAHQQLKTLLGDQKVDFLFIDGGHSYDDVSHDYHQYLQYMKRPSIIGFHDVYQSDALSDGGSHVGFFWERMKRIYPKYDEFQFHSSMGIGLVYLEPEAS